MKSSYIITPRTMEDATWVAGGQAIHHYPQSRTEVAAGVVLAVVIGIALAALLVHWATQ
jgi:ABC-type nitrate/sulfonate/bicarbonate transport system permease component